MAASAIELGAQPASTVFVVDDDDSVRDALQGLLASVGLRSKAFASAEAFLDYDEVHTSAHTSCLVVDIRMPGMSGLDLQAKLKAESYLIPIIFITAHGDEKMRLRAMRAGAVGFLPKPFASGVLLDRVRAALGE